MIQGCSPSGASLNYDMDKVDLDVRNGVTYEDGHPYTGYLYKLNPNGHDSLYTARYKDGLLDGTVTKWFDNGQVMERRVYEHNVKDGIHEGFWPNGHKKFRFHLSNGFYEGTQWEWFESGKVYHKKTYLKGQEDGPQQEWNENGALVINYESHNGRQYGNIGKKNCASVWREDVYAKPAK